MVAKYAGVARIRLGRGARLGRRRSPASHSHFDHGWATARTRQHCVGLNQLGAPCSTGSAVPIRAEKLATYFSMSQTITDIAADETPLPENQRELELLLEALQALTEALDHYEEIEPIAKSRTVLSGANLEGASTPHS